MSVARVLLSGAIAALAGCAVTPSTDSGPYVAHALTRDEARQVEADMLAGLGASDALFSGLQAARGASGALVVCGWVRLRSPAHEYARYPHNRPFAAHYARAAQRLEGFRMMHFADERSEASSLYTYCLQRGISL